MKTIYTLFFLNIFISSFAQEVDIIYIELNNDFKIIKSNNNNVILQSYLFIREEKSFDSYYFNIQTNFESLEKSEGLLSHKKYKTLDDINYKKLSPCELHEFFSSKKEFYLIYKKNGKFYGWNMFYEGTSKNTIISIQKTRL